MKRVFEARLKQAVPKWLVMLVALMLGAVAVQPVAAGARQSDDSEPTPTTGPRE